MNIISVYRTSANSRFNECLENSRISVKRFGKMFTKTEVRIKELLISRAASWFSKINGKTAWCIFKNLIEWIFHLVRKFEIEFCRGPNVAPSCLGGSWGKRTWIWKDLECSIFQYDYVYWTGDLPPHNVWEQTREGQLDIYKNLTTLFLKYFKDTPIYSALGNHESAPVNRWAWKCNR